MNDACILHELGDLRFHRKSLRTNESNQDQVLRSVLQLQIGLPMVYHEAEVLTNLKKLL